MRSADRATGLLRRDVQNVHRFFTAAGLRQRASSALRRKGFVAGALSLVMAAVAVVGAGDLEAATPALEALARSLPESTAVNVACALWQLKTEMPPTTGAEAEQKNKPTMLRSGGLSRLERISAFRTAATRLVKATRPELLPGDGDADAARRILPSAVAAVRLPEYLLVPSKAGRGSISPW